MLEHAACRWGAHSGNRGPGHDEGTYETPKGTADPFFGKPIRPGDHPESTNPPHSPRLTYGCSCATHALSKRTLHTPVPARLESAAPRLQSRPAVSEPPNPADPSLVTIPDDRQAGFWPACVHPGETVCPPSLGTGAYPRLPRNLRPDSPLVVSTKSPPRAFPLRAPARNEASFSAPSESRTERLWGQ